MDCLESDENLETRRQLVSALATFASESLERSKAEFDKMRYKQLFPTPSTNYEQCIKFASEIIFKSDHCSICLMPYNSKYRRMVIDTCGCQKCRLCIASSHQGCTDCHRDRYTADEIRAFIIEVCKKTGNQIVDVHQEAKISEKEMVDDEAVIEGIDSSKEKCTSVRGNQKQVEARKFFGRSLRSRSKSQRSLIKINQIKKSTSLKHEDFNMKQLGALRKRIRRKRHTTVNGCKSRKNVITNKKSRRFICGICNKILKTRQGLDKHNRTHTGESPYQCKVCGRRFNDSSNLTRHMTNHTGLFMFICEQCGAKFRHNGALAQHIQRHTINRPYLCNIQNCTKDFKCKKDLKKHLLIHSDKGYNCEVCSRHFKRSDNMKRHVRSVHGDEDTV